MVADQVHVELGGHGAVGLVLNLTSIVAFAVCFAVVSTGSAALAALLGAIATFAASTGCFLIDGNRSRDARLDETAVV